MIEPKDLTEEMLEEIALGFDSIELCDKTCLNIFIKNKWSLHKTVEWAKSDKLYLKRAAFVIMAGLAEEDSERENLVFRVFMPIMIRESCDERGEIREAIIWALKAIAQRNSTLEKLAIKTAKEMLALECDSAHEIGGSLLG